LYDINLYDCDNGNYTLIDTIPIGTTCYPAFRPLLNCPDRNYICTISGSFSGTPDRPVFVEWYWYQDAALVAEFRYSGKLTFVGTQKWLENLYNANGGSFTGSPYSIGLPLLNTSNHST
jgi:hypothetical protein